MEHNEHLDEGTVHAWLDGALTPDEAARIERHVAGCNDCAALVAEARGLIAASSRILASLDDVPAAVLPASGAGTGAAAAMAASATRSRFVRPAATRAPRLRRVAAAAAVAIVALGTAVLYESGGGRLVTDYAVPESASESAPAAVQAEAPVADADVRQEEERADRRAGQAAAAPGGDVRRERQRAANVPAVPPAAPRAVPSPAPPPAVADSSARALAAVAREAAAASSRNMAADAATPSRADTTSRPRRLSPALSAESITRYESLRVTGERKAAIAAGQAAAASTVSPERIVGCWALSRSTAATAAGVPEQFALEEEVVGMEGGQAVRAAHALGAAPGDATRWRWTMDEGGEPVLLRGAGATASRFPLTLAPTPAGRGERLPMRRIDCPRR